MAKKLTPKQEAFVRAYLETGNASEAYRRAYKPKKMSNANVMTEASRLLKHPVIAPRVASEKEKVVADHGVTVGWIVEKLKKIAECEDKKQRAHQLSALDKLARYRGLYEKEGDAGGNVIVNLPDLSSRIAPPPARFAKRGGARGAA